MSDFDNPGPPPEASAYLRNKDMLPSFSWQDVEPQEHAVAFTVAKATGIDVLTDIREELQSALDEGLPFAEFQRRLQPRLEARGWWGYGGARDGVRGEQPALLGTPRRLRTIYDANLRSARAAGQWERIERTRDRLPYLTYRLGPSERHRPHHETKEGLTLLATDPFWVRWMPPNGWGCKCWVRQITAAQAERIGIDTSPVIETRPFENTRTGEITYVPVGIDPGWDRNPGLMRRQAVADHLAGRMTSAPEAVARVAARDIASSWTVQRMMAGGVEGRVPIALVPQAIADRLGSGARIVEMSDEYAAKITRPGRAATPDVMMRINEAIWSGPLALETVNGVESLLVFVDGERPWFASIKHIARTGELFLQAAHQSDAAQWATKLRRGTVEVLRL